LIRLGIDSRDAFAADARGTGKTLKALIQHLLPLIPDWSIMLYTNRMDGASFPVPARTRHIDIRGDRLNAWERFRLPLAAFTDRIHLLHCPSQTSPSLAPCPVVLTIHDLIPLRMNDGWAPAEIDRFRRILVHSVKKARRIIAVSEFTRQDLIEMFPAAKGKVDVIRWGVEQSPIPSRGEIEAACNLLGIDRPYFVAFGGESPRKNVSRILEATAIFCREVSTDVLLVLMGVQGAARIRINSSIKHLDIIKQVVTLGYITDQTVRCLLRGAEAMVYPSLYEGFGLPILEAMAVGAPVITSSLTSLPEVAGDAAILLDPTVTGMIVEAMKACYLCDRAKSDLRERGWRRVQDFTWDRAAAETLAVYKSALG